MQPSTGQLNLVFTAIRCVYPAC